LAFAPVEIREASAANAIEWAENGSQKSAVKFRISDKGGEKTQ